MVLLFSTTLGVGVVGMTSMLAIKRYELRSGRVLFRNIRPYLCTFLQHGVWLVGRLLPLVVQRFAERGARTAASAAHRFVAHAIVTVEYWLQRTLDLLHLATHTPTPTTPASAFLREVAAHKKSLLRHARQGAYIVRE